MIWCRAVATSSLDYRDFASVSYGTEMKLDGNLTDILVGELMSQTHPLRLVLDRPSIHDGLSELFYDRFVNGVALSILSLAI